MPEFFKNAYFTKTEVLKCISLEGRPQTVYLDLSCKASDNIHHDDLLHYKTENVGYLRELEGGLSRK